ncbi:hypothetical protein KRR40_39185 [Niabella defluvii]|nr:hypothetical protein KRR40_39185 [Niabella sp. I65]
MAEGEADHINVDRERKSLELRKGYIMSQYSIEGTRLATFRSSKEAALHTRVQREQVNAMATRDDLLLHGCIWRYGDAPALSREEVERIQRNLVSEKRKDITQYDLIGKRIDYFPSINVASQKTGVPIGSIRSSADGYKVTGSGFIWRRGKERCSFSFRKRHALLVIN